MTPHDDNDDLKKWSEESIDYKSNKVFELSDEQQKIVDLDAGQHLVLAPPGTGKTEMLVHRLSKAINSGIPQNKIACLTFTNRAAENMVERVHKAIGDNDIFIGNIHSYCNRYLREYNLIPQITSLLDEEDQALIIHEVISEIGSNIKEKIEHLKSINNNADTMSLEGELFHHEKIAEQDSRKKLLAHLTHLKRKKLKFDDDINSDAMDFTKMYKPEKNKQSAFNIYKKYELLKKESDYIDFDDLLTLAYYDLMSNHKTNHLNPLYQWIQIDEVQDLNPLQWAIIDKISNKQYSHRVFFGDYEQAIFSFMGASQANLDIVRKNCKVHNLKTNYRSPQYLLDLYNKYAIDELGVDWGVKPISSKNIQMPINSLVIEKYVGVNKGWCHQGHEADFIVRSKFPTKDDITTAILVRTNVAADTFEEYFREIHPNLNIFKVSGRDLFSRRITKDVMATLKVLVDNRDKIAWTRCLHLFAGLTLKDSRPIIDKLFEVGINPLDVITNTRSEKPFLDEFLSKFNNKRVIVFDTETTGLDTKLGDVIQIAAIEIVQGRVCRTFEVYIDTELDFSEAEKIHHISKDFLIANATDKHTALSDFIDFIDDSALIAHNLDYDYKILNSNLERTGLPAISKKHDLYDSVEIVKRLYPKFPRYKLEYLLEKLNIKGDNSHNAMDDVKATFNLISHCATMILNTRNSRLNAVDEKISKILIKFADRLYPLYQHLTKKSNTTNISNTVLDVVTYINENINSASNKYEDIAYSELKKLTTHMKKTCKNNNTLGGVMEYILDYTKYKEVDLRLEDDKIVIATVHKAKGLEFDYVIIPSCANDTFPNYYAVLAKKRGDMQAMNEEARLFYVAMTRAKSKLLITHSSGKFIEQLGRSVPQNQSDFLNHISEMFDKKIIEIC
jgi:DNA helicase-2/ATP-dependent DNA helicase PcrA